MNFLVEKNGFIHGGKQRWSCALGRAGIAEKQREGDGITPLGTYSFGRVFWRPDRIAQISTELKCVPLTKSMGWCDDPDQQDYNTLIELPHAAGFEHLWRDDHIYDVIVEILYNTNPIISGLGSAIFMHIVRPDFSPTEGCIALNKNDLLDLLRLVNKQSKLSVGQK